MERVDSISGSHLTLPHRWAGQTKRRHGKLSLARRKQFKQESGSPNGKVEQDASQSGEFGSVAPLGSQQASGAVSKYYGMPTMNSAIQSKSVESRSPMSSWSRASPTSGGDGRAPCLQLK